MHSRSLKTIDPSHSYTTSGDRARRVFTDQADVACTKRERGPGGEGRRVLIYEGRAGRGREREWGAMGRGGGVG